MTRTRTPESIARRNAERRRRYREDPAYRERRLASDKRTFVPGERSRLAPAVQLERLIRIQESDLRGHVRYWPRVGTLRSSSLNHPDLRARADAWHDPTFDAVCERLGI